MFLMIFVILFIAFSTEDNIMTINIFLSGATKAEESEFWCVILRLRTVLLIH
jgi:hypothetical protein